MCFEKEQQTNKKKERFIFSFFLIFVSLLLAEYSSENSTPNQNIDRYQTLKDRYI